MTKRYLLYFLMFLPVALCAQEINDFNRLPLTPDMPEWAKKLYVKDTELNVFELDAIYKPWGKTFDSLKVAVAKAGDQAGRPLIERFEHYKRYVKYYTRWRARVYPFLQRDGSLDFSIQLPEARPSAASRLRASNWSYLGPVVTRWRQNDNAAQPLAPWQANVYSFDIASSNNNILYCGTETGVVNKTTDKGLNWSTVGTDYFTNNIGAIAIHPSNPDIVYVSELSSRIATTTDGGATWTTALNVSSFNCEDLKIKPDEPEVVLAAGTSLRRRTAGNIWTNVLNQRTYDLAFKPDDPSIVYALVRNVALDLCEFWKSTDGGQTWSIRSTGWITGVTDGGARMTVTPADNNRIYCVLLTGSGPRVMRSDDAGENWTIIAASNETGLIGPCTSGPLSMTNGQGFFDLSIVASQTNADHILLGTTTSFKSTDGGVSYTTLAGYCGPFETHPDIQEMMSKGGDTWIATDGGMNYSSDFFTDPTVGNNYHVRINNLRGTEFWGFDSGWNEDVLIGGRYHNGNSAWRESYPAGDFLRMGGGEAPTGYINPGNPALTYFSDIGGRILPTNNTQAVQSFTVTKWPNEAFYPMEGGEQEWDPRYMYTYYLGNGNQFWKTSDNGLTFSSLFTHSNATAEIRYVEVSRTNPDVIYFTTFVSSPSQDGELWKTTDGGVNWTKCNNPGTLTGSQRRNSKITLSGTDANTLWWCFRTGPNGQKIFKSTDGGSSWTNWTTATLDNTSASDILHQLGTDGGVYYVSATGDKVLYRDNNATDWTPYNTNLPLNLSGDFQGPLAKAFYKGKKLRLATGHGIWEADLYTPSTTTLVQPMVDNPNPSCSRDTLQLESYSVVNGAATYQWAISPTPQWINNANIRNPKIVLGSNAGFYSVTLTVTDDNGVTSRTFSNFLHNLSTGNQCGADTIPGKSLVLAASGDYAQAGSNLNLNSNTVSMTAWIKRNGTQVDFAGIVYARGGTTSSGLSITSSNGLRYTWNDAGGSYGFNTNFTIPDNVWTHIALVITPTNATVYMNGRAATRTAAHAADAFDTPIKIGYDNGSRYFKGEIDEVTIWNKSLTQNEIRELMHLTLNPALQPNLVSYYQFNEQSGIAFDKVNVRHANLLGTATRVVSTGPFGGGTSNRQTVSSGGLKTFTGTGAKLAFPPSGTYPNGEIVVSRINMAPDSLPPCSNYAADNHYWIIENFGTNPSFSALDSARFENILVPSADSISSSSYQLNRRTIPAAVAASANGAANAHKLPWTIHPGTSITSSGGPSGHITFGSAAAITEFGQFLPTNALDSAIISGPASVCSGADATLTAANGYATYNWSNGGGTNPMATFNTITATTTFTVTVTNGSGCTGVGTFVVSVTAGTTYYQDQDNDGFGNPGISQQACSPPSNYVLDNTDCNDNDALEKPGQIWYADVDNDGYSNGTTQTQCLRPVGYKVASELTATTGDCNDNNQLINPAAVEICDGVDNDCNAMIDDGLSFVTYYTDADNDGYGIGSGQSYCANPGTGFATQAGDCNDGNHLINPGAPETCDGIDNNCNTLVDDGLTFTTYYTDADNDGYGTGTGQSLCANPGFGFATQAGDCDDANHLINPGATEICDGIDNNCDGTIDGPSVCPDYTITTTAGAIVITDVAGNGEALAVSENGSNIRFNATGRTYSLNGGLTMNLPADVALAGASSITVNAAVGNDNINIGAFTANLPSLTINGGVGDDEVSFNGDISFAVNANLDVDLQNDDATPGIDAFSVGTNANLLLTGTGTVVVKVSRNVTLGLNSSIETENGNLSIEANQQTVSSTGYFTGIRLFSGAIVQSIDGTVSLTGRGGTDSSGIQHGIENRGTIATTGTGELLLQGTGGPSGTDNDGVRNGGSISAMGSGNIQITGFSPTSGASEAFANQPGGTATTTVGDITIDGDIVYLDPASSVSAGTNKVTLAPTTAGRIINLGSDDTATRLGLTDAELDRVTAGTLIIGNASSGAITVSANITRSAATNLQLVSNSDVTIGGGGINAAGGTVLLDPGASPAAVKPTFTGTDVTASTLSFGSDLAIVINGTTPGSGYNQLTVSGVVNLSGVELKLSGTHTPANGQSFTIVDNDGSADAIVGTFTGLAQGATITNFLGSNFNATISYTGGDGNDVVLTMIDNVVCYADTDNDGYGDPNNSMTFSGSCGTGFVSDNTDCNDNNFAINPGVTEICDGIDNNCNGLTDEGVLTTYYADVDQDGFGNPAVSQQACSQPSGYVTNNTDCDDNDALEKPGQVWYADVDNDGYSSGTTLTQCLRPVGYKVASELTATSGDCNDNNNAINPGATEICDGIDNNCNGSTDEGELTTYYADADNDGFGNPAVSQQACSQPSGYVTNNTDCDDNDALEKPGQIWYADVDNDGYSSGTTLTQCLRPVGYKVASELTATSGDCNDNNFAIKPSATEICDGIDNNCNGSTDEGVTTTYYADADNDGFGNPSVSQQACSQPSGYVTNNTDCDDNDVLEKPGQVWYADVDNDGYSSGTTLTQCLRPVGYKVASELTATSGDCNDNDPAINPTATEVCDGVDNNCDGVTDEGCTPPMVSIHDPCTCMNNSPLIDNGTTTNAGTFSETVEIQSPSGQTWTIVSVTGLYSDVNATTAYTAGATIPETGVGTGVFELFGYHRDGQGYTISVTNGDTTLSIGNTCYYPDPVFTGLPALVSPNAAPFTVTGTVANNAAGTGTFILDGVPQAGASPAPTALTINPATLSVGTHTLVYSFDAGTPGSQNPNDPGCVQQVQQRFRVAHCGCQDVTVSLDENCQFLLTGNLVSDVNCGGGTVRVMDNDPSNGGLIDCAGVWTYGLFDAFGNIICWGKVTAEDKTAPVLVCAPADFTLDCYDVNYVLNNRLTIGNVGATSSPRPSSSSPQTINNAEGVAGTGDNCQLGLAPPSLVSDNIKNLGYAYFKDNCYNCGCRITLKWSDKVEFYSCEQMKANGGIYATISREWTATDCNGMRSSYVQKIKFTRPAVDDFVFNGPGEGKYDRVVEYNSCTPDKSLIKKEDVTPYVCSYFNSSANPRCLFIDQVECNYSVSIKDTEFPICGGKGVKIDRELYVLDWCAGGIVDTFHILIKIGDFEGPTATYAEHAPYEISTGPMDCTAAIPVSVAGIKSAFGVTIKDNCNLGNISAKVYTKDRYVKGILVYEGDKSPFCNNWVRNPQAELREESIHGILGPNEHHQKEDICWEPVEYAVMNGMMIGLPVGKHLMVIDAFDGCYNSSSFYFVFEVKDKIAPVMKCDDDLHVTLSNANGYTSGYAQVSSEDIDEGSWDNCKLAWIAVRRNVPDGCAASFIQKGYDTNGNGKLDALPADGDVSKADGFDLNGDGDIADFGETFIMKGGKLMTPLLDYVEFFCCDLTERVTVELWGGDIYGNTNYCWMDLLIEDKVAPTCLAPWDVTIYCDDKNIAQIDDKIASAKIFGDVTIPTGNDCAALDTAYSTEKKLKCGAGYIDRIWTLTKQTVKGPISITCTQRIWVNPVHEYNICFPKDVSTDCKTPIIDTVITDELGCDILAVNVHDKRYDASDDECYKIFRTYSVINWCTYDDRCGDPLLQTNISIIDRAVFGNYGKAPIYVLVRDREDNRRDGIEEFYISKDLIHNNADDIRFKPAYCEVAGEFYHSFIYTQIIKVYDDTRPVVTGTRDTFCTSPTACTANITKVVTLKDNCTDKVELETQFLMIAPFQTLEAGKMILYSTPRWSTKDLGNGQFEISVSNLPEGTHDLIVVGRDECGNLSLPTRIPFVVKDCKAPAPICINGLSVDLMPDGNGGGMMTVWASDFVASKIYDCNGQGPETKDGLKLITKYSVNRVLEPVDPNQTSISVNCADLELGFILVELHAWDEAGNHDFCITFVEVQDNNKVCPAPADKVKISGTIATEGAGNLQGVSVTLSGSGTQSDMTGTDGNYEFVNITKGGDFTVTPQLDKNHLNGVSTFDLVLIQKHILGVQALNSPYKMIAADANNSKSISTLDMIQIRKLILNIDTHFANNTSWRFVDATYRFPNATNPWSTSFPEVVSVNDLVTNVRANFVAIKVGDVNASASVNGATSAEIRTNEDFKLNTQEQNLKSGNEYKVTFTAEDLKNIQGYQFALNLDQSKLELLDIEYGVAKAENFGVFKNEGIITTSWNSKYEPGTLFSLVLRAKADAKLSSTLSLNRLVSPEAYDQNNENLGIALNFEGIQATEAYELKQNTPNPFSAETLIGFSLPKATKGTLTVRDVKGALVYKVEGNYAKGNNQVSLKKEQLGASGVLYYTLETSDFTATKKMIILQ